MPDAITLVRWRDAQADPPGHPGGVVTDLGLAWYGHTPRSEGPWYSELGAYGSPPLDPQPRWWCDPQPPTSEQLLADLRHIVAVDLTDTDEMEAAKARVRALLPKEDEDE